MIYSLCQPPNALVLLVFISLGPCVLQEKLVSACLRDSLSACVLVCLKLRACAGGLVEEFWTHVKFFHVLWGRRPRACSQCELKAQQGHLSLDSTPIVLSFLPAMFQRGALKRWRRRRERGGGRGKKRGPLFISFLYSQGLQWWPGLIIHSKGNEGITQIQRVSGSWMLSVKILL